jgi:hypothetical protein
MILSGLCAITWAQTASAVQISKLTYRFSKPALTYAAFRNDRRDCLMASAHAKSHHWDGFDFNDVDYEMPVFKRCMLDRGYEPAPNGFKTSFRYADIKPLSGHLAE